MSLRAARANDGRVSIDCLRLQAVDRPTMLSCCGDDAPLVEC